RSPVGPGSACCAINRAEVHASQGISGRTGGCGVDLRALLAAEALRHIAPSNGLTACFSQPMNKAHQVRCFTSGGSFMNAKGPGIELVNQLDANGNRV
ncbi:MAG: hypothetical protein ACK53L_33030, partial [Pirellulaceae bacterium]